MTQPEAEPQTRPETEPAYRSFTLSALDYRVEHPVDARAILSEQLAQSNQVLRECWRAQRDDRNSIAVQLDVLKIAARLMKINLKQAQSLDPRPREFVHRIVVERVVERLDEPAIAEGAWHGDSAELAPAPVLAGQGGPPAKILKTIHGGGPRIHTP